MDYMTRLKTILDDAQREAFQAGWEAAFNHIMTTAKQPPSIPGTIPTQGTFPLGAEVKKGDSDMPPVIDLVRHFVEMRPGEAGFTVVKAIQASFPDKDPKSLDRTTRTALARLKERGEVENREGKWWPIEKYAT